jgi:hypothetical protein
MSHFYVCSTVSTCHQVGHGWVNNDKNHKLVPKLKVKMNETDFPMMQTCYSVI